MSHSIAVPEVLMLALTLALVPDAAACGGFFCNNIDPVEQAGEVIVFEVDPEANDGGGETTMHVQVSYEGPPIEFAWVVPVKGEPDLFVSHDLLFQALGQITRPQFYTYWEAEGECAIWDYMAVDADAGGGPVPAPPQAENDSGVQVLASERVGPYETVVLAAQDETVLVEWLQDNSYAVPSGMTTTLAPYVADGHNFVALRLAADQDTGDLVPLGMRYAGDTPAIPIQLTSVAATPDMQLITYVLGPDRAVPSNYYHVELNKAAVNWFTGGDNYMDVLSRAADEAGGHAFATEFAGDTTMFEGRFYSSTWDTLDFSTHTSPTAFIVAVTSGGLPASANLLEILETYVPVPEGYDSQDVYNCPSCYPELDDVMVGFDALSADQAIHEEILWPLESIEAMFDRSERLTRLGSTMSPAEMTIDPMFTFNGDLEQDVSNIHQARLVYLCDEATTDDTYWTAPKNLVVDGETVIRIPSNEHLSEQGLTEADFLAGLLEPAAARIETIGSTGAPEVIYDGSEEIAENIDDLNDEADVIEGRGCSTAPGGSLVLGLFAVLPLARRRRA